jgi:hypothetical protein
MVWYVTTWKPMESKRLNRLEVLNEIGLILMTDQLFMVSEIVKEPETRFKNGWVHVGTLILLLVLNLGDFFVNIVIKPSIDSCKKKREERRRKALIKPMSLEMIIAHSAGGMSLTVDRHLNPISLEEMISRTAANHPDNFIGVNPDQQQITSLDLVVDKEDSDPQGKGQVKDVLLDGADFQRQRGNELETLNFDKESDPREE